MISTTLEIYLTYLAYIYFSIYLSICPIYINPLSLFLSLTRFSCPLLFIYINVFIMNHTCHIIETPWFVRHACQRWHDRLDMTWSSIQ